MAPDPSSEPIDRLLSGSDRLFRRLRQFLAAITPGPVRRLWRTIVYSINRQMPKGLLGRSLLIIVLPMIILQTVVAVVFMERHRTLVTDQLSAGVVRQIAMLIDEIEARPPDAAVTALLETAKNRLLFDVELVPGAVPTATAPTGDFLETTLTRELAARIGRPSRVDTLSVPNRVVIEVSTARGSLNLNFSRNLAYASNWHIFIVWMVGTALVLIVLSVVFIRNQIKPLQRLADAAETFGKGRPADDFKPGGAREVRRAAIAFTEMRKRIERQIEQRTAMLAGVSHDLRTILTRFRLELAMQPESEETQSMSRDVDEMEAMLEAYLAFAKGDVDEAATAVNMEELIEDMAARAWGSATVCPRFSGTPMVMLRPNAIRRLIANLLANASRFGDRVEISANHASGWLTLAVDDNGPGIPEAEREAVFKPFYRLDEARNQDHPGTGLGLAIARDIARSHGGEIRLETSPLGGLRSVVRLPG